MSVSPAPVVDRPWRCRNGHMLGRVVRRGRRRVLELFERADSPARVRAVLHAGVVVCSACAAEREWHVGEILCEYERPY